MKTTIPSTDKTTATQSQAKNPSPSFRAPNSGHLAQLAAMMHQSPQVQAQLKLRDEIHNSEHVQSQMVLASEINHAPVAQARLEEEMPAQREAVPNPRGSQQAPGLLMLGQNRDGLPHQPRTGESHSAITLDHVKAPSAIMPVQRVTIERTEINQREDSGAATQADQESLGFNGFYDGGGNAGIEAIIDEYIERNPEADFASDDAWTKEITMRAELINGMNMINDQQLFGYNWTADQWSLPEQNWESVPAQGGRSGVAFAPRAGTSRLTAIRDLFRDPEEDESYYLDCSAAILAVHYRALAEVMEASEAGSFDRQYPRAKAIINPEGVRGVRPGARMIAPPGEDLYDIARVRSLDELLPGDWVYFKNFSDYERTHEGAEAAWAGEHAIYMGGGRYRGFGTASKTYAQMVETLIDRYNNQARKGTSPKKDKDEREENAESITEELPGIVEVRRAKRPA